MNQRLSEILGQIDFYGSTLSATYSRRANAPRKQKITREADGRKSSKKSKSNHKSF
jgi:hypothetical protein